MKMAQPPNEIMRPIGTYGFNWAEQEGELTTEQVDLQEAVNATYEKDAEKIKKDADEAFKREYQKRLFKNVQRGWVNTPPIPKCPAIMQPPPKKEG